LSSSASHIPQNREDEDDDKKEDERGRRRNCPTLYSKAGE
jgi:hypothetical protein